MVISLPVPIYLTHPTSACVLYLRVYSHFLVMIFTHLPTAPLSFCSFSLFSSSLVFFILVSHKALMEFTVPKHTVTPVMMTLHALSLAYNLCVLVTLTLVGKSTEL